MELSNLELLQLQVETLYVLDEYNRIIAVNEQDSNQVIPRFFLSRSTEGNIWRFRHDLQDDIKDKLEKLVSSEPIVDDLIRSPFHFDKYLDLLDASIDNISSGPSYYLPPLDLSSKAQLVLEENISLVTQHFPYTAKSFKERSPIVVMEDDGVAVSVCFSSRNTDLAAEAGVFTIDEYQGKGYATEVVLGWSKEIRASDKIPLYSTSWDNTASQRVAEKTNAKLYGTTFSIA